MNAAQRVIAKFGGQTKLASLIERGQSTVQHWAKSGNIPVKWHSTLLEIARRNNINLSPSDFILQPDVEVLPIERLPIARWPGILKISEVDELPCYVLDDGRRVISRGGATKMLTDGKGGGNLENYVNVQALKPYIRDEFADRMIEFELPGVVNRTVKGITAEDFLTICNAYVRAREVGALTTERQYDIARKANMMLIACAKVGLLALIDEATGYQYDREQDALQVKLKLFLEEEMRKWEKTFPDELWMEFGRLTGWQEPLRERPKYWGKLVMELVYENLDPDVADWLRINAPKPKHGSNYHQWLSSQYGLQRLIQHIWMVVGIARTCITMYELREKVALQFGREPVQLMLFMPPPIRAK